MQKQIKKKRPSKQSKPHKRTEKQKRKARLDRLNSIAKIQNELDFGLKMP